MAELVGQEICSCGTAFSSVGNFCHSCGQIRATPREDPIPPLDIEAFARQAAETLNEDGCLIVLFQPWSETEGIPAGVIAPAKGGEGARLGETNLKVAMAGITLVLMPCTFETESEEAAANGIIDELSKFDGVNLFIVFFASPHGHPSLDDVEDVMKRYEVAMRMRADDVITLDDVMNSRDICPKKLRQTVASAVFRHGIWAQHIEDRLAQEPQGMDPSDLQALQQQHRQLLLREIPKEFLVGFPVEDPTLFEGHGEVASYKFVDICESPSRSVMHALCDKTGIDYIVKAIDQTTIQSPADIESLYRETKLLERLVHPNITHLHEFIRSQTCFYIVLEYAGPLNLAQVLTTSPRQRLDIQDSFDCFQQLAMGLAHCHEKGVVHRDVCLENMVRKPMDGDGYHWTLVGFSSATAWRRTLNASKACMVCGRLPCIAPEVATGGPYTPDLADSWSAGVVLLEMSGGMSSLSQAVGFDIAAEPRSVANDIHIFFNATGNHAKALAYMGSVSDADIIQILEMLLTPESIRQSMHDWLSSLPPN